MKRITAAAKSAAVALLAALLVVSPLTAAQAAPAPGATLPYIGAEAEAKGGVNIIGDSVTRGYNYRAMPVLFPVYTVAGEAPDLFAYCIEMDVPAEVGVEATTGTWDEFPGTNDFTKPSVQRKVGWIISNSYPKVSLEQLAKAAGISGLGEGEAIGATQAAIWHYTDGFVLRGSEGDRAQVKAVYDYLTGEANVGLDFGQIAPSVELTSQAGDDEKAGGPVGPVTVKTNQESVKVSVDSKLPVVDAQGRKVDLDAVKDGAQLNLDVPADEAAGSAEFTSSVTGSSRSGHLLKVPNTRRGADHAQTLIVVNTENTRDSSSAEVSWKAAEQPTPTPSETPTETPSEVPSETPSEAPSETPTAAPSETATEAPSAAPSATPTQPAPRAEDDVRALPRTGATVAGSIGLAAALIAAGGVVLWFARRRSS